MTGGVQRIAQNLLNDSSPLCWDPVQPLLDLNGESVKTTMKRHLSGVFHAEKSRYLQYLISAGRQWERTNKQLALSAASGGKRVDDLCLSRGNDALAP